MAGDIINLETTKRGEIWLVNFDPTVGSEIKKIRPAIIISSDAARKLPIKLVAPITDWKPYFAKKFCQVKIEPDTEICELGLAIAIFFDEPSFYKLGQNAIGSEN